MIVVRYKTHWIKLDAKSAQETPMKKYDVYSTVKPNESLNTSVISEDSTAFIIPFNIIHANRYSTDCEMYRNSTEDRKNNVKGPIHLAYSKTNDYFMY